MLLPTYCVPLKEKKMLFLPNGQSESLKMEMRDWGGGSVSRGLTAQHEDLIPVPQTHVTKADLVESF